MAIVRSLAGFALTAAMMATGTSAAAEVTIYRCTGAQGQLTLRDTPCRTGEKQETREMVRPRDPPPRPAPPAPPAPVAEAPRQTAPRYVVVTPPRPMYECITPDGERYVSETGEGRPRWQPLWVSGYPVYPYPRGPYGGYGATLGYSGSRVSASVRIGDRYPVTRPVPVVPVHPGGSWVRDECYTLPQAEVCDRLRDERYELNRRWNIAQPSERARIDRETRGIDARLTNDCGGA